MTLLSPTTSICRLRGYSWCPAQIPPDAFYPSGHQFPHLLCALLCPVGTYDFLQRTAFGAWSPLLTECREFICCPSRHSEPLPRLGLVSSMELSCLGFRLNPFWSVIYLPVLPPLFLGLSLTSQPCLTFPLSSPASQTFLFPQGVVSLKSLGHKHLFRICFYRMLPTLFN